MSILGTIGTISLIILLFVLARLSEKFGAVVRMRPLYRYYYLALIIGLISVVVHIVVVRAAVSPMEFPAWITTPWFLLVAYHLPLAIAVTISVYVTWHYWRWLITEYNE